MISASEIAGTSRMRVAAACLATASVLALIGTFAPLFEVPHAPGGSIKLYNSMHYTLIVWAVALAVPAGLAYLALTRGDRIVAALIFGYCAPVVGGLATYVVVLTQPAGSGLSFGWGYYLLAASDAAEVAALAVAASVLFRHEGDRARVADRRGRLAVLAAVLLAASAALRPERFRGLSVWEFDHVSARVDVAIVVGLVVVALIPLVARRVANRPAGFVLIGLAAAQAIRASDAVLDRLYTPRFNQLTVGFWISLLAVAILVGLGSSLLGSAGDATLTPVGGIAPHASL